MRGIELDVFFPSVTYLTHIGRSVIYSAELGRTSHSRECRVNASAGRSDLNLRGGNLMKSRHHFLDILPVILLACSLPAAPAQTATQVVFAG